MTKLEACPHCSAETEEQGFRYDFQWCGCGWTLAGTYRERLAQNASQFDSIVDAILHENEHLLRFAAELHCALMYDNQERANEAWRALPDRLRSRLEYLETRAEADEHEYEEGMRLNEDDTVICHFVPQAWVRDYAIEVDPEGPTKFEIPRAEAKEHIRHWPGNRDMLDWDAFKSYAAQWAAEWSGPFEIKVEESDTLREEVEEDEQSEQSEHDYAPGGPGTA